MIQSVSFPSAAFEIHIYVYLLFLVSPSAKKKKNAEAIKFLGILKRYVTKNIFYLKKAMFSLNKKVFFVFHTISKLVFITQIIFCIIHRCLCSFFVLFCSVTSVSKKTEHRNNVNCSLFIQLGKVQ